jgi:hypothetical protein
MNRTLVALAALGMLAACESEGPAPKVPSAPAQDPEGAQFARETKADPPPAKAKMACNGTMDMSAPDGGK